jgi:uncharacterized protein involved in outer membrane biogenesis
MKWLKRLFILGGVLIAAALALPLLIPLNTYVPRIERLASERLQEPVSIGALRASLLPRPRIELRQIVVGRARGLEIGSIGVVVDVFSLWKPVKVLNSIELDSVSINREMLGRIPVWAKSDGGPATVKVERVRFRHVRLLLPNLKLAPFSGEADLSGAGGLKSATLKTDDGKLNAEVKPEGDGFAVTATGRQWQAPAGPPLLFDELVLRAKITSHDATISDVDARLYGGTAKGSVRLAWAEGWKLRGKLKSSRIELREAVPPFTRKVPISGRLNASAEFSSEAKTAAGLGEAVKARVAFDVLDGVLYQVDLAGAAGAGKREVRGGQTRFDHLSGVLEMGNGYYRFTRLNISSGVLNASGNVSISPAKRLDGRVNVALRGSANLVNVPLVVSGTASDPVLLPSTAAMAGAAAGTMLLGPGLGTGLGIKAGEAVEKLLK